MRRNSTKFRAVLQGRQERKQPRALRMEILESQVKDLQKRLVTTLGGRSPEATGQEKGESSGKKRPEGTLDEAKEREDRRDRSRRFRRRKGSADAPKDLKMKEEEDEEEEEAGEEEEEEEEEEKEKKRGTR